MSAFRFMMQQHNSRQSRLKVTDHTRLLAMDNSFTVGTASTYTSRRVYTGSNATQRKTTHGDALVKMIGSRAPIDLLEKYAECPQ